MNTTWIIAACVGAATALPAAAQPSELNGRIETLLSNAKLAGARVGVSVLDLDGGRTLAEIHADEPFTPASNMKILTSGTALTVLGKDFAFRTELILDGDRLILRGSGDPALGDPVVLEKSPDKPTVETLLAALAASVKKAGVEHVSTVIVDDRVFDREFVHPTWPKDQLDKWYCAEVAGVNFHANVLAAFPKPSVDGIGRPPSADLEPAAPWLEIENKARTVATKKNSFWLNRDPDANRFTMFGEVGTPSRVPVEITLHEVPTFAGQLIAAELVKAGVPVGDAPAGDGMRIGRAQLESAARAVRLVEPGETFNGRTVALVTTPIEDVLNRCNTDSQNLYAESMIKRVGHDVTKEPGSWTNGSSVVRMTLAQHLGPDATASTVVTDGSGMSREDRVSPRTLTKWLDRLQRDSALGPIFVTSLATEHRESIRYRLRDNHLSCELHAKTGTINGVRCFSGYLVDPITGHKVAFSVMVNDLKEGEQVGEALMFQGDVVALADKWLVAHRPPKESTPGTRAHVPG